MAKLVAPRLVRHAPVCAHRCRTHRRLPLYSRLCGFHTSACISCRLGPQILARVPAFVETHPSLRHTADLFWGCRPVEQCRCHLLLDFLLGAVSGSLVGRLGARRVCRIGITIGGLVATRAGSWPLPGAEAGVSNRTKRCSHSMTSSARASSESGTVMPRALPVLRLIDSSKVVGC